MRNDVNFFRRNKAEQFAQFILRIYQLVQDMSTTHDIDPKCTRTRHYERENSKH